MNAEVMDDVMFPARAGVVLRRLFPVLSSPYVPRASGGGPLVHRPLPPHS